MTESKKETEIDAWKKRLKMYSEQLEKNSLSPNNIKKEFIEEGKRHYPNLNDKEKEDFNRIIELFEGPNMPYMKTVPSIMDVSDRGSKKEMIERSVERKKKTIENAQKRKERYKKKSG